MLRKSRWKIPGRAAQFVAAGVAVAIAVVAGASAVWVFRPSGREGNASLWRHVFSDRATLGFIRAAFVMLAIYAIGSLAALLVSGRWIRSIGKGGLETDATQSADEKIAELEQRVRQADEGRDRTLLLLEVFLRG